MTATPAPGPLRKRRPAATPRSTAATTQAARPDVPPDAPSAAPSAGPPAATAPPRGRESATARSAQPTDGEPSTARPAAGQPPAGHPGPGGPPAAPVPGEPPTPRPGEPASPGRAAGTDRTTSTTRLAQATTSTTHPARATGNSHPGRTTGATPPVRAAGPAATATDGASGPARAPRPPLPDEDPRYYLEQGARQLRAWLPAATLERIEAWRADPTPWLELTGLPQAEVEVPTPRDGFCDEALLTVPNLVHFGLLSLLGLEPVAFRWENHGRLIRNVAPSPRAARSQTSWGYATGLDWHTDDSVLDHRAGGAPTESIPHFLSFYGMRNHERVPTWLLPVDEVLAGLPAATCDALRQPDFDVSAPESYRPAPTAPPGASATTPTPAPDGAGAHEPGASGTEPRSARPRPAGPADRTGKPPLRTGVPLLWTLPDGNTGLRYGPGRVTGRTAASREALARFTERIAACAGVPVTVEAGGFQIFDNRRVMHRRLPFEPAAADRARWLRRCYARTAAA